ncbi:universal stress protein [Agarilytica rhodophyticola]|uniref:universal stress protein n=1 Tax=Agarilytica rhodophyticola TaxID=1737490 RepID=UPI000B349992|nr:universal stress protein [Agarilytica rhodophyticola]
MSVYQHILVGLDLSDDSKAILEKAYDFARLNEAHITLAHIIEPFPVVYGGDMPVDLTEAQNVMQKQSQKHLAKLASEYEIPESDQIIELGQTGSALHELADELNADLIIVGSHGRHGLALIWGSTANSIIKGAQCDVLAIRV